MVLAVDLGQSGSRYRTLDSEYVSKRAKQAHESTLDVLNDLFAEIQENFKKNRDRRQTVSPFQFFLLVSIFAVAS